MNDIKVASWNELNDLLFADAWRENLRRMRSPFVFRGVQIPAHAPLTTSLTRIGGNYQDRELPMLRSFTKYARREQTPHEIVWNWLAIAQHHGLPTRLLDWTYSPYVALHFATADIEAFNQDGLIWCVNSDATLQFLPDKLQQISKESSALVFTAEILSEGAADIKELHRLEKESGTEFVIFLEPPSLDERIVNQFALFSLMSNPITRLDHWLAAKADQVPNLYRRLIIPAELKWEIRDRLDQANITERVLFPGLDGLGQWLKRYYTLRE